MSGTGEPLDWVARSGARAKGRRPDFLGDPHHERLLSMVMALVAEVSVLRERLDTVERLLDARGTVSRADIEGFQPDLEVGKERNRLIREMLARVMRGLQQEVEAMDADDPPIDDVVQDLLR